MSSKKRALLLKDVAERYPWLPYVAPFAAFMVLTEPARYFPVIAAWLYIVKTVITALLLWIFRDSYRQDLAARLTFRQGIEAATCGLIVLALWILAEGRLFQLKSSTPFDPHATAPLVFWIGIRLLGSSLIVPVMEELFWRSMLMRWLIAPDFRSVPLGSFTWFSFLAIAVLFGLEHNRIFAGIGAGILYNLLMVYQKNLKGVILAHAVTNLGLGTYVTATESWVFW